MSRVVSDNVAAEVRLRAKGLCEYCQIPDESSYFGFQIDHIIALNHRGPSSMENLAWVCKRCNNFKGANIASIDPDTGRILALFNPRKYKWRVHFEMREGTIFPLTSKGRTTLSLLKMNDPGVVAYRKFYFATKQ